MLSFQAFAQPPGGGFGRRGGMDPEKMADEQTNKLKEELDLNNKQTKQVRELTENYLVNVMALNMEFPRRDTTQETRSARREAMQSLETDHTASMKNILSESQFETFEQIQKERREKARERRQDKGKGKRPPRPDQN